MVINRCSIPNGATCFVKDVSQSYLVFQVFKYFQILTGTDEVFVWKSKGFLEESVKTPVASGNSFAPRLTFIYNGRIGAKFKGYKIIQCKII